MATNSVSLQTQHNSTNTLPRMIIAIDKLDAIKMLEDIIFLKIDGIILNWNMYSFSVPIDTLGVKTVCLRLVDGCSTAEAANRDKLIQQIALATSTETKEDTTPISTLIKIEPIKVKHEADMDQ
ncbi:hypothetical protein PAXRUDRAFT_17869 [Paxillus rubicundulus Ve08.2h10]|uniref:Uncharacterized protein n=1 Tax=Paxillus rubicundulus Ve08.2h10 TaxID=930991 RepID=A0A0D0D062_9AGAM|nr:hypothetical protein PAXRUDRAFT_17869 [Paxillus rubicundulus Ve08.2h10]